MVDFLPSSVCSSMSDDEQASPENRRTFGGKWYDLAKLGVGFLLTGVIGTGVSQTYKQREIRGEVQRKQIEAATNAFYEVTDSFSKRHYYALLANASVEQWNNKGDPKWRAVEGRKLIEDAFRTYNDSITEWNLRRFHLEAILETHFGKHYRADLDENINPILGGTRDNLMDLRDHALDENYFDQSLHDTIFDWIENREEPAILKFCDELSQAIKDREKASEGFFP
jgi:hypothetical protein